MFDVKFYNPMSKVIEFFSKFFNRNSDEPEQANGLFLSSEEEYETWLGV